MHLQLGDVFTIVVFSPEYAREVMKLSVANEIVTVAAGFAIADLFPSAKWLQLLTGYSILANTSMKISLPLTNIFGARSERDIKTYHKLCNGRDGKGSTVMKKAQVDVRE
ncbi:hypothetical protein Lal_00023740, partial [Lupinus albus]